MQGATVFTIDFDTEEERDQCVRLLDSLGVGEPSSSESPSEESGSVDLEEIGRRMRELRKSLQRARGDSS